MLSTSAAGPAAMRGGAMRVGGYILGALISVLSASLLFRHLGVTDTGSYVNALTLVAIVGAFSDLGLTAVGLREMAQRPVDERWSLARDLLGLRITLTLIGSVIIVAIARAAYSTTLAEGVALACVGLLLQATQDNFALPLVVGLRLGWVAALDLTRQLLTTLLTVALVVAGATLLPFLGMSIPVGAIVLVATVVLVHGTRTLAPTFSWMRWRKFMGAMIPYSAAIAASALYFRVSILLVSALSSSTQLGYFSASFRIIEVLTAVPALLAGAAFPIFARAARDDHNRLGYSLGRVFEVALIAGAWVAVSTAVGAPLAIAIIGGAEFAPAVPVLALQGVGLGAMFVSLVWANGLLGLGLFRTILAISVTALAVNAMMVAPLVLLDGARGAAIGTALAEILLAVVQCLAVVRGRPQLRPSLRTMPKVALAATFGLLPLAMTGIPVIARLAISTALFTACLLATRAFPPELLDLLPGLAARWRSR
ncbi:MAG TPA: oligosaccharide flippase family protein [Solirubrobacteraceae bacterium]|nr:oligosaccharide flippase family protein [Solirubrobacteraceae bacterium]